MITQIRYIITFCIVFSCVNRAALAQETNTISLGETNSESILAQARKLKNLWKFEEAIALLENNASDSTCYSVLSELADCYYLTDRNREAEMLYSYLKQNSEDNIFYSIRLMAINYRAGNYPMSIVHGQDVLSKDSIPAVLSLIGDSYNKMNCSDSAYIFYEHALCKRPSEARTAEKMCDILLKDKEYDKVIEIADHFLETNQGNESITSIRGLAYYLKGDYSKSLSEFEGILVNNPDNIGAHYYTGLNHYRMGNYFWALKELELSYEQDSSNVNLIVYLADTKAHLYSDFDEKAKPLYERAMSILQPDSSIVSNICYTWAMNLFNAREYSKAMKKFKEAHSFTPARSSCLYYTARCHDSLNETKQAISYFNKYIESSGEKHNSVLEYAKRRLAALKEEEFMSQAR